MLKVTERCISQWIFKEALVKFIAQHIIAADIKIFKSLPTGAIVGAGSGYLMYKLNNWLQKIDKGHHPANEVTGLFVGLGTSYLLYHMNHLIQMGKKRRPMRTPVF